VPADASCKSLIVEKTVYVGIPDENLSTNPKSVAGVTQPEGDEITISSKLKGVGEVDHVTLPFFVT